MGAAPPPDESWTTLRVGGFDAPALTVTPGVTKTGDEAPFYRAGAVAISAALPASYPPPTPPGAIELKRYPTLRQAVKATNAGEGDAFFPLFRHIASRDIAMTAPVVMTGRMAGSEDEPTSMAFLYRTNEMGQIGEAERGVVVVDEAPVSVISIGFQGGRGEKRLEDLRLTLDGWLFAQPSSSGRWVAAGPARLLGYNGPDTPWALKWWELQVPVRWQPAQ